MKKLLNILVTVILIILVFLAVSAFCRFAGDLRLTPETRSDYLAVLGIMYSVIFITTSLLATLSNKDDVVYYENATDYVLINPPVYNFFGLSVLSYIALAAATLSVVKLWTEMFLSSFVLGIGFVIILFFKMTTIYFRRSHIKKILGSDFGKEIERGRIDEAKEKINHLYLNSLKSVDKKNFDICIENLQFLQEACGYSPVRDYCIEVIKKLLVQISSSDLFYFTRVIELFQSDSKHESFLRITPMRHYVAQLLIDRVVNENDAVTLMSLYSIYVEETVGIIDEMSGEAMKKISSEEASLASAEESGAEKFGDHLLIKDPETYLRFFREVYGGISEETQLLAEVMVLYETLDTSWTDKMDAICSLPNVLAELWEMEKHLDYVENPFRGELRGYRHFIESYVSCAVSYSRPLKYLDVLEKRRFALTGSGQLFAADNILICDPYRPWDGPEAGIRSGRELTPGDFIHKAVCSEAVSCTDRQKLSGLLKRLPVCYCDVVVTDEEEYSADEDEENVPVTGRLRDDHVWILEKMISLRNSVGVCMMLRKILHDVDDYNYYFYGGEVLCLDAERSRNIYSKIKNYYNVADASEKEELGTYISSAKLFFVNNIDF